MVVKKWIAVIALVAACSTVGSVMADKLRTSGQGSQHDPASQAQLRSTELVGTTICNRQNEELGEISDIVVDPAGHGSYVLFSHGGVLGIGGKTIVVPWNALKFQRGTDEGEEIKVVADIDKQRLDQAPSFTEDNWPDFGNQKFTSKVNSFYGVEPSGSQGQQQPQPSGEHRLRMDQTAPKTGDGQPIGRMKLQKPDSGAQERYPSGESKQSGSQQRSPSTPQEGKY